MTSAIPLQNVPLVDSNGKITIAWQRFLLSLAQGGASFTLTVDGISGNVSSVNFGDGLYGTVSGGAATITSGLDITTDAGANITNISSIHLDGFDISGTSPSLTISSPNSGIAVGVSNVVINKNAEFLNFIGLVDVTSIGDTVFISVGAPVFQNHGTNIGTGTTINAGSLLSASSLGGQLIELDFTGISAQQGMASLGAFFDLDIGHGLAGNIGTGSLSGTLSLSGLAEWEQAGTLISLPITTLGTNLTLNSGTLNASGGTALVIENQGTSIGTASTINAGANLSAAISGSVATFIGNAGIIAQVGTTTQSVGTLDAGSNIVFNGTSPNLTISATGTLSGGIVVANNGASTGTVGTISADGSTTTFNSTGTISALGGGGGITITDGVQTLPVSTLKVNNLGLVQIGGNPAVVQTRNFATGGTVRLLGAVTPGNTILIITIGPSPVSLLGGIPLLSSDGSFASGLCAYSAVASSSVSPSFSASYPAHIFEISGVVSVGSASTAVSDSSSTYSVPVSISSPESLVIVATLDPSVNNNGTGAGSFSSGGVLLSQDATIAAQSVGGLVFGVSDATVGTTAFTFHDATNRYNTALVIKFDGSAVPVASITPSIPVTINGMPEGSFQNMVITTGNAVTTATLSGSILTLALGTP